LTATKLFLQANGVPRQGSATACYHRTGASLDRKRATIFIAYNVDKKPHSLRVHRGLLQYHIKLYETGKTPDKCVAALECTHYKPNEKRLASIVLRVL